MSLSDPNLLSRVYLLFKIMKIKYLLLLAGAFSSGCASLGYMDNSEFVALLNTKPRSCDAARSMVASKSYHSTDDRLAYLGHFELYCGDKYEGLSMLSESASFGNKWAASALAREGASLPRYTSPPMGGSPNQRLDIRIDK